mmetsp:Transcript_14806/g.60179  ORF Transcript_14806/g.60179 Transcript_14806/m.60179 type:complete len:167 (+) Transcript_14806:1253-1753(+)
MFISDGMRKNLRTKRTRSTYRLGPTTDAGSRPTDFFMISSRLLTSFHFSLARYYKRLNSILDDELFRQGSFKMIGAFDAGQGDRQVWRLTTFKWTLGARKCIAVFNYSDEESGGHIALDDITATDKDYKIQELLGGNEYSRNPQELKSPGLFVWLRPFGMQFFQYT